MDPSRKTCNIASQLKLEPGNIVEMFRLDSPNIGYHVSYHVNDSYGESWTRYFMKPNQVFTYLGHEKVQNLLFTLGLASLGEYSLSSKWLLDDKIVYLHWTSPTNHPASYFRVVV